MSHILMSHNSPSFTPRYPLKR